MDDSEMNQKHVPRKIPTDVPEGSIVPQYAIRIRFHSSSYDYYWASTSTVGIGTDHEDYC